MHMLPKKLLSGILSLTLVGSTFFVFPMNTFATTGLADTASVQLSDSRPSQASVAYAAKFNIGSTASIKCINVVFSLNADGTGGVPTGLVTIGATKLGSVTGTGVTNGNWSLYTTGNSGTLQWENGTGESHTAADAITSFQATGLTNPSLAANTAFYAVITTYSTLTTHACTGVVDTSNTIALVTTTGVAASVTVQPTLSFAVTNYGSAVNGSGSSGLVTTTSSTLPFGVLAAGANASGSQTLTTSTNAKSGATIYVRYTGQLTDTATDTISNTAGTNASPTTYTANTFGYTTDGVGAAQFTSNTWAALTTTNAAVVTRSVPLSAVTDHVEYKVGIGNTQQPGTYTTTITYTATPNF